MVTFTILSLGIIGDQLKVVLQANQLNEGLWRERPSPHFTNLRRQNGRFVPRFSREISRIIRKALG